MKFSVEDSQTSVVAEEDINNTASRTSGQSHSPVWKWGFIGSN